MKVLFINLPYYGHVVPTIGLVQELIARGCEVTYLMPFGWEKTVAESGATFCGYKNHRQLSEQIKNAYLVADSIVDSFDCVVYEQFFFLGKHLAEAHHKPAVRIFTAPATNGTLMKKYIAKGPLSVFRYGWITKAFTKDIVKHIEKQTGQRIPMKTDHWLDEILYDPPELNLVYALRQFQLYEEEFSDDQYVFLGPSIYERKEDPLDFVKGDNPVIYISLGTILRGAEAFFQNCMEAFRGETVDVVLSVGPKFDTKKLKNIPPNVHIYKRVPQWEVLKMTDVFVTHGGMNSVSEALVHGVPIVVIPFVSDQPVNARRVEALGVGRQMEYTKVDKETLRQTVFSVMNNSEIRENLETVKDWIQEAPGNAGGAERILEYTKKSMTV